jgi:hypothetical protein
MKEYARREGARGAEGGRSTRVRESGWGEKEGDYKSEQSKSVEGRSED